MPKVYAAPRLEVFGYKPERGFATSCSLTALDDTFLGSKDNLIEVYDDHSRWTEDDLSWFWDE